MSEYLKQKAKYAVTKYKGKLSLKTRIAVEKFKVGKEKPYEVIVKKGNVALNEGINAIWTLVCGGSETVYDNTNARVGVGDGTSAEDSSQTGLQGVNQAFKQMNATYPQYGSNQKAVFQGTFNDGEAEFAWEEFTVDNGATPNKNLVRKVTSVGTKPSGEIWRLTIEVLGS